MFVRTKKIKDKDYAYLVENEWTPWGSRQKVTKYLGRSHSLQKTSGHEAELPSGYSDAAKAAIVQELKNHGFEEQKEGLTKEQFRVNIDKGEITDGKKRRDSASFFAARFAAREAFFKALGTGWGRGLPLREVSVTRGEAGQPGFELSDRVREELSRKQVARIHLSITHEGDSAQAFVIMEGGAS